MRTAMAKLDDKALVQMALAGHGEYFAELVQRHTNTVARRALSIVRSESDAEDVVQEVFLKAWRALPTFRADASIRTWLTAIATNEALQFYRRQRRHNWEPLGEFDTMVCHSEPADKAVIRGEQERAIRGAILKLPLKYREIVILRDLEELSTNATAERLKSTVPAVKTRLLRGRLRLAAALRDMRAPTVQAA